MDSDPLSRLSTSPIQFRLCILRVHASLLTAMTGLNTQNSGTYTLGRTQPQTTAVHKAPIASAIMLFNPISNDADELGNDDDDVVNSINRNPSRRDSIEDPPPRRKDHFNLSSDSRAGHAVVDLSSGQNVDLNRFLEQSFPQIDGANDQYDSGDHRSRQAKRPRYDDPIEWSPYDAQIVAKTPLEILFTDMGDVRHRLARLEQGQMHKSGPSESVPTVQTL
ncbi:hypothetical protein KCU67_g4150, partial [Aureobasidium melanogenum]